jgi:hypothetical protein
MSAEGSIEQAGDDMNVALQDKITVVQRLLAEADATEARTRHKVGEVVLDIRNSESTYGLRAVERMARALGRDKATLYHYAEVAAAWSAGDLEALLRRHNPHGQPLSWSHLVELAGVAPDRRGDLVEQVLREGLSVRALAAIVREPSLEAETACGGEAAIARFIAVVERAAACASFDTSILTTQVSPGLLERAIAAQEDLQTICSRNLEQLKATRARQSIAKEASRPRTVPAPRFKPDGRGPTPLLLAGYASA